MANGSAKRGDAIASREHDEWDRFERELTAAEREHDRAAAEREAAVERDQARGKLESWNDLEEITGSIARVSREAALEGVKVGRELRSPPPVQSIPASVRRVASSRWGKVVGAVVTLAGALGALYQALKEAGVF